MEKTAIQDFVIASLSGSASTSQQAMLQEWLSASNSNRSLYSEIKRIWETAGNTPFGVFNTNEGLEMLMQQVQPVSHNRWWLKVAAILLPLFVITGWYFYYSSTSHWNTYIASGVLKDSLLLPDGSLVYLKPGTALHYKRREVILGNGEAFFRIVKDEKQEFRIKAGNAVIHVLGTSFNVKRTPAGADVIIWDGKVSLEGKSNTVTLTRGKMGIVDQYTGEVSGIEGNYEYRCGWANNDLAFNNQALGIVLEELSALYHIQLKVMDPAILKRNVTIRFREIPLAVALAILSETMDLTISNVTDTTYILTERK
ncbi:FecR family protein [Chitinophaga sp. CF118]|uniref:FecR family protein n=1 Tax=Chitinophaga sp. CF118 TaxID=1884367 RepID=UPI0008EA4124|nr:FecR domain-containing protein [Chitinophaga sp. CF118]SFD63861.1 FecR family protein [Chitinophaga sp. CF118]